MEDQYVDHSHHSHHPAEFYSHPPQFTSSSTKEEQGESQVMTVLILVNNKAIKPSGHME